MKLRDGPDTAADEGRLIAATDCRTPPPVALHIITALNAGGAEAMLAKLAERGISGFEQQVVSMLSPGFVGRRIASTGVDLATLGLKQRLPDPLAAVRLLRLARTVSPALIQGWMYHGNLAASVAGLATRTTPVLWNVRHSLTSTADEKPMTRLLLRLSALVSSRVDAIIYNSHAAVRQHQAVGFSDRRALVIPNGFDCDLFRPDARARQLLAERFQIGTCALIVGVIARYHPMKDHLNLIRAVAQCRDSGLDVALLLVGDGLDPLPPRLAVLKSMPPDRVAVSGARSDVAEWLAGLDVLVLPSAWGEGFPNIIGEAMACGVPCIATDVGDCRRIIGDAGLCVPPRDSTALAAALKAIAGLSPDERRQMGLRGRHRVCKLYRIADIADQYATLYRSVLARGRQRPDTGPVRALRTR